MYAQIVLFDGFDPIDVIAPFDVFAATDFAVGGDVVVELVSAEGPRPVVSATQGLVLQATGQLDPTRPGYVVVPGAAGTLQGDPDEGAETIPVLLARAAQSGAAPLLREALNNPDITVVTVCGGSLLLAMAGLIEGRHATAPRGALDMLAATGVHAVAARVVDDGDLLTAGGVTSSLDLALYVVEREYGPKVASAVEALFEYERRGTIWRDVGLEPLPAWTPLNDETPYARTSSTASLQSVRTGR